MTRSFMGELGGWMRAKTGVKKQGQGRTEQGGGGVVGGEGRGVMM